MCNPSLETERLPKWPSRFHPLPTSSDLLGARQSRRPSSRRQMHTGRQAHDTLHLTCAIVSADTQQLMKAWSRESKVQKGRESSFSRPRQRLAPAEKQLRSVKRMKRDRLVRRCAPRRCSGASSGSHTLRTVLPVLLAPGAGCPVDDRRAQNPVTHVLHFSCMQELAWWQGDEFVFMLRIQCGHRQNFENGGSSSISPPSESRSSADVRIANTENRDTRCCFERSRTSSDSEST